MRGYKGGRVEDQINQDRAFVASPFGTLGSDSREGKEEEEEICGAEEGEEEEDEEEDDPSSCPRFGGGEGTMLLLGVFDGHGNLGEVVSDYATRRVPEVLSEKIRRIDAASAVASPSVRDDDDDDKREEEEEVEAIKRALTETFVEVDLEGRADLGIRTGGCTASIVLLRGTRVYLANAGDSRSLVAAYYPTRGGSGEGGGGAGVGGRVKVLYISREDKPHLPKERERVERMGGRVWMPTAEELSEGDSSRVFYVDPRTGRSSGGLAMSRSLGDWDLGDVGVIPDPLVHILDLRDAVAVGDNAVKPEGEEEEEEGAVFFAVSATDGMFDYLSPQDVAEAVAGGMFGDW